MFLSTTLLRIIPSTSKKKLSKVRNVNKTRMEQLADFVRKTRDVKGLSTTDVEKNSGKQITDGYVSQIENLYVKNVSPEKLSALAKGLGVTEEEVFAIARGKVPNVNTIIDERFETLSLKFGGLKPSKKVKAEVLIDVLEREIERMAKETD